MSPAKPVKAEVDAFDMITELTSAHTHREHYTVRVNGAWSPKDHQTMVPPLLLQLLSSPVVSSAPIGESLVPFGSRPTARIEALDCLVRIDMEASRWLRDLGQEDPTDTLLLVRRIGGLLRSQPGVTRRELERDVRRWWTQARIVTGWDSPAWRPDNTCPLCSVRGGLRVKLADQTALCVECGETWTPESIALLADHIRGENADQVAAS